MLTGNLPFDGTRDEIRQKQLISINNSTVSDNTAREGGGIANIGFMLGEATVSIDNSTVSGNSATFVGGGISSKVDQGGGTVRLTITSTLSGNSAPSAGGISSYQAAGQGALHLVIGDTILKAGATGANVFGAIFSLGYNLSSDSTGPNNGYDRPDQY